MYYLFFVCIWLKNSIFGEFSNIYLLSAQNRVKWRHKIRPIAKNFRPILIFFARDDAKLMPGEVCQVSCRYSNKWRSYSRKTEGGVGSDPPPGGGGLMPSTMESLVKSQITKWPFFSGSYDYGGTRLYEGPISLTAGATMAKSWIRLWPAGHTVAPPTCDVMTGRPEPSRRA